MKVTMKWKIKFLDSDGVLIKNGTIDIPQGFNDHEILDTNYYFQIFVPTDLQWNSYREPLLEKITESFGYIITAWPIKKLCNMKKRMLVCCIYKVITEPLRDPSSARIGILKKIP